MKTQEITTCKGSFVVMDMPTQLNELSYVDHTTLDYNGKKIKPINFLSDVTESECKEIVENYGPFGEFKGSEHPNGGAMRYRAYGSAVTAFKCLINEEFENAYVFKII